MFNFDRIFKPRSVEIIRYDSKPILDCKITCVLLCSSLCFGHLDDKHPIYRLRLPKKYECTSVGKSIIGNELPTEFGNAGTQALVTLRINFVFVYVYKYHELG